MDQFCAKRSKMNIETVCNQQWYLALYITGGKNRENLFDWLHDRRITPWTPLSLTQIRRADAPHVFRKRTSAVFPGYFFLKANFEFQKVEKSFYFDRFSVVRGRDTPLSKATLRTLYIGHHTLPESAWGARDGEHHRNVWTPDRH